MMMTGDERGRISEIYQKIGECKYSLMLEKDLRLRTDTQQIAPNNIVVKWQLHEMTVLSVESP